MTKWTDKTISCEDCDEYDGTYCRNLLSDHYGHSVSRFHPACEHVSFPDMEPPICKKCKLQYVEDEKHGGLCPYCYEGRI